MKIMICGKGGCGKSTVASLLAKEYAAVGKRVLVIDADESNYGLHRQLGAELPRDFTLYFGSKKGIFQKVDKKHPEMSPFDRRWTLDDLPPEFVTKSGAGINPPRQSHGREISEEPGNPGILLMSVGKIHEADEGCACPMGTLARHLVSNLDLGKNDVVLVDAEAGVEHFGRGVDGAMDVILMVVDPSYESLMLSRKIKEMGKSIGKPVYYVLNKINEEKKAVMESSVPAAGIIASIPESQPILLKGLLGEALDCEEPEIRRIVSFLDGLEIT